MSDEFLRGIFISEIKNRFLCQVNIDDEIVECYIPSSCRLSNFLSLEGKEVLLKRTHGKNTRTDYAVYAVKYKRGFLMLNLTEANRAVEREIHRKIFKDLGSRKRVDREVTIDGYKTDLYIPDTKMIIEIKSLLTISKKGEFPTVYSERANNQLSKILKLLEEGYKVCYMLVSLNPYVKNIELSKSESEFRKLFLECINNGMLCMGFSLKIVGGEPTVYHRIEVNGLIT